MNSLPETAFTWCKYLIVGLVCTLVLSACGGGGGGEPGVAGDEDAPILIISSPADGLFTDDESVVITGTANDVSPIQSILAGGVLATTTDNFETWTVTVPLIVGANTITVTASDVRGNESTDTITVNRRNFEAPSVTITNATNGMQVTTAAFTLEGTALGDAPITSITVNGVAATSSDNFATWQALVSLTLGNNVITVATADADGDVENTAEQINIVLVDLTPPVVAFTSPVDGSGLTTGNQLIQGTASDNFTHVGVSVNGIDAVSSDGFATWSASVPLQLGSNVISAVATDNSDNSTTAQITLTGLDQTAPLVSISSPAAGASIEAREVVITGTASDESNITAVRVNGAVATTTDNFLTWEFNAPLSVVGANNFTISTEDALGNSNANAAQIELTRTDAVAPSVAIATPSDGLTLEAGLNEVTGTAGDSQAVASVSVNGIAASSTDNFATWTATNVPIAVGANTLTAVSVDEGGNMSAPVEISITGETAAPPVVVVTSPSQASVEINADAITLIGTATDTSTIAAVRINGVVVDTTDGFLNWRQDLSLSLGENLLSIEAEDIAGRMSTPMVVSVTYTNSPSNPSPVTNILFPVEGSKITSSTITVRGTASDTDGVEKVLVNNILATSSDGFASWQATVPVSVGSAFSFRIDAYDVAGSIGVEPAALVLEAISGEGLDNWRSIVPDPMTDDLFILTTDTVIKVNKLTGQAEYVGDVSGVGSSRQSLAYDNVNQRLLIHQSSSSFVWMDPDTGVVTQVPSGSGPSLISSSNMALDAQSQKAFIVKREGSTDVAIIEVDLLTGNKTELVSSLASLVSFTELSTTTPTSFNPATGELICVAKDNNSSGREIVFIDLNAMTQSTLAYSGATSSASVMSLSSNGQTAYLTGSDAESIIELDLSTGVATLLYDNMDESYLVDPRGVVLDETLDKFYFIDQDILFEADNGTNMVQAIFGKHVGAGLRPHTFEGLAWDEVNQRFLMLGFREFLEAAAVSGDRAIAYNLGSVVGSARNAEITKVDSLNSVIFTYNTLNRIYEIDLALDTFNQLVTPDATDINIYPAGAAYDAVRGLYVVGGKNTSSASGISALYSVDPATGDREVVSSDSVGSGIAFEDIDALVVDATNDRYLVVGSKGFFAIDPDSGDRTELIAAADIGNLSCIEFEVNPTSVFVCGQDALVRVDMNTLAQTVVASDTVGVGRVLNGTEIHYDAVSGVAYVMDDGIYAVDTVSGDRTIVSY